MNYNYLIHPLSKEHVPILSAEGKHLLKQYIYSLNNIESKPFLQMGGTKLNDFKNKVYRLRNANNKHSTVYYRDRDNDGRQREAPNGGLYTVTKEYPKIKNDYYYALQKYKSGELLYHVNGKHLLERSKKIPKGTTVRVQNADGIYETVQASNGEIENNKVLRVIQYEGEHGERLYTLEDPSTKIRYTSVDEKHLHPIQSRSVY